MRTFALICLLLAAIPSTCQNESFAVKGVVLNPEGKPIERAFVLIRDYQQPSAGYISDSWESRTGADGSFSFTAPRGCYDIFVSANLQLPSAQRVCVQRELRGVRIKLKADPHPTLLQS
jgi:hypothetical protein